MKHPHPDNIEDAMATLERYTHHADPVLDMACAYVARGGNACGTVACVGGWYAYAQLAAHNLLSWDAWDEKGRDYDSYIPYRDCDVLMAGPDSDSDEGGEPVNYQTGANELARDLGFNDADALTSWASANPKLWGNEYGHCAFDSAVAYHNGDGGPDNFKVDLDDVIAHWRKVANRIEARNLPKSAYLSPSAYS